MTRTAARVTVLFALIGFAASTASAYVHYRLLKDPTYTSFCDVSATASCTQVYQSRFSAVGGVPVAVVGAAWFAFVLILFAAGRWGPATVRENVPGYLFVLSTAGLAAVLYLAYASFVLVKAVCVLCVAVYVSVVAIFLISGASATMSMTSLPRRAWRDLRTLVTMPLALAIAVVFAAGVASAVAFFPRGDEQPAQEAAESKAMAARRAEFLREWVKAPRVSLPVPRDGAKVLVVKFNDYQCPPCRQTYLNYLRVFAKYEQERPGQVRLVLRDFPLDPECNSSVTAMVHASACEAAAAVRLAREHQLDPNMEQWLFLNQASLSPALIRQAARDVGHVTDFDARYTSTLEQVKADIALGQRLGVRSTPTFFVNGAKWEGGLDPMYFDAAIAYELEHAAP